MPGHALIVHVLRHLEDVARLITKHAGLALTMATPPTGNEEALSSSDPLKASSMHGPVTRHTVGDLGWVDVDALHVLGQLSVWEGVADAQH